MRKSLKIALIAIGSMAALVALVLIAAPPIAKSYVNHHGKDLIGRQIELGQLRLNVPAGHLTLRNLTVYEDDGTTPFVHFDTLDVRARLLKLLGREVDIRSLRLTDFNGNVIQNGNTFNFNSIIDHFKSDDDDDDTTASAPWTLRFNNIKMLRAKMFYADLQRDKEWNVHDINLIVPGFVIGTQANSEAGLSLALADGGTVSLKAHHDVATNNFEVEARVDNFALANIKEYLTTTLNINSLQGVASIQAKANGNLDEPAQSTLSGTVDVSNIAVQTTDNKTIAELGHLFLDINKANISTKQFYVKELVIDGLGGQFERYNDHTNFSTLIVSAKSKPNTTDSPEPDTLSVPSHPLDMKIERLSLVNSHFTYIDHTLPDPFAFPVTNIHLDAQNVSFNGTNSARLGASLPGGGHAMARWKGNINHWKESQDLFLTIKGLDMKQFSPWLVAYFGMPFSDGILGFTSRNTIKNSTLNGNNKLDIYKLQVGETRRDIKPELHLPLKPALYILKDKDDKILLDLPIYGNIDNPEFNYMKLVWKTLQNLLVKVATSPARAIGNALGINDKDLDFMAVDPAQHGLNSEQYHQLGVLAQIATYDTAVVLTFEQIMPPSTDESTTRRYNMFNEAIRRYLTEQGAAENQIVITTSQSADAKRTGYAISSAILTDEPFEEPEEL